MKGLLSKFRHYGWKQFLSFCIGELRQRTINRVLLHSYSQSYEDLILDRLTKHKKKGFYIDVGAFDPVRFNNTLRFYNRGWRGINIEPSTYQWNKFVTSRKRDININVGIGRKPGKLIYYDMDPATLSTFSKRQSLLYTKEGFHIVSKRSVPVVKLSDIVSRYAKNIHIDFISIDVEGFEIDVLKSNNWITNRPYILCIETTQADKKYIDKYKKIVSYLRKVQYQLIEDNGLNTFFIDRK